MKKDIDWGEINEDLIREKVREGIKLQKKQFDHLLRCGACMDKFVEIMKCQASIFSRKKKE
jgi:hypothetical protein